MQGSARWWMIGLAVGALVLAPWWGAALVANEGFRLFQQHDWAGSAARWDAASAWAGPRGEWLRLSSMVNDRQNNNYRAWDLARQAVAADPDALLPLLQLGLTQEKMLQQDAALESWRRAGAAPYFCTQATQALYQATPPDPARAAAAAMTCTALDPTAGAGWLVLGQAQAAQGQDAAALAAFAPASVRRLAAGQPGRAAVAAATAAEIAQRLGDTSAATWQRRARALAPTVCADPARPRDPNLDALCANP